MTEAVVSSSWHRVADLRPSLVPGLRIVRQAVRDQLWQLLVEPASGRQVRLNPAAWDLVGRFDGRDTVGALWQRVLQLRGEQAPTQDEVLRLLTQLFRGGVIQFDAAPHLSLLFARRAQDEGERRRGALMNPLMLRTRLADPGPLLQRLAPLARILFGRAVFALWLVAVAVAVLAAAVHFGELKAHVLRLLDAPRGFLVAWICYPCIKLLHELGHGLAVRRYGGEVREFGVSLMFLVPAPYVDASAANTFAEPRQRMVVSAAGIAVELGLAALALGVWLAVEPGAVRDAAAMTAFIGSVSTLLFNANPLLRLDGYHVLCDALQLPNLASRSQAWWLREWLRLTGRATASGEVQIARGERKWLIAYAPASWAWRFALLVALVTWIGGHSWLLGWTAALFVAVWLARRAWLWLGAAGQRARRAGAIAAGVAVLLLAVVPAPHSVVVRGVVWPPPQAQVRAGVAGFVQEVVVPDGASVVAGQGLLRLADPALVARRDRLVAEETGLRAQQYAALLTAPASAQRLEAELQRSHAELERVEEQLASLEVRAASAGRIAWTRPQDLPGSFARQGALLGHVVAPGQAQVRVALPEEDFARVREGVTGAQVVLAEDPFTAHAARLVPSLPGATRELPTPALGERFGGPIPVEAQDKDGVRARVPVFLLDVALQGHDAGRMGGRATVKLALQPEPVAWQVARRARQLLVGQFAPTGQL